MVPVESSTGFYPVVSDFYDFISNTDVHYYGNIYMGMIHLHIMEHGIPGLRRVPKRALEVKGRASSLLQRHIDDLVASREPATDSLISMIYSKAAHDINLDALDIPPPMHPLSPLANFQLLQSIGSFKFDPRHTKAMYELVAQRGGIYYIRSTVGYQIAL